MGRSKNVEISLRLKDVVFNSVVCAAFGMMLAAAFSSTPAFADDAIYDRGAALNASNRAADVNSADSSAGFQDWSAANSWRYSDGIPQDEMDSDHQGGIQLFSDRDVAQVTWTQSNGVYYGSDGKVVSNAMGFGIDVSQWQETIDWRKVKESGVEFAIIRCGWGNNYQSQDDRYFVQNVRGCIENDIDFGVYIYSYGYDTSMALSEAQHVLRLLEEAGLEPSDVILPVYYDLENQGAEGGPNAGVPCGLDNNNEEHRISNAMLYSMAEIFCTTIENAGYEAGVYANLNWWNNFLSDSRFDQWSRWVAEYYYGSTSSTAYTGAYDLWQCMSWGRIDGISGNVDINFCYSEDFQSVDELASKYKDALPDGTYTIAALGDTSKVLDVSSASLANGGNVQLYSSNQTLAQQWRISHDSRGYLTIVNVNSGKALDVYSALASSGANVWQYTSNGSTAQKWVAVPNDDGSFTLVSALSRKLCLDVSGGQMADYANVQIYQSNNTQAQKWSIQVIDGLAQMDQLALQNRDTIPDGSYYVAFAGDLSKVLDVPSASSADAVAMQLYTRNGTAAQLWDVSHDEAGYVTFTNASSGKVLDVNSGLTVSATRVQQYQGNDSRAQKWVVSQNDDGTYSILSALWPGIALDVSGAQVVDGAAVQTYQQNSSLGQKWHLINEGTMRANLDALASANAGLLPDGEYVISSQIAPRNALDVSGASSANGANVQSYASNMTNAQNWIVTHDDKGYITFSNASSGKVLDVESAGITNATNVHQYEGNGSYAQKWIVTADSLDGFTVRSALWPDLVLDVANGSSASGANVQVYDANETFAQSWLFFSTSPVVEPCNDLGLVGSYAIAASSDPSYVLDISGGSKSSQANVQLYAANQTAAQSFEFRYINGYYQILNVGSGMALDVSGGNVLPGTNIWQYYPVEGEDNQLFAAVANEDGTYTFVSKSTGLALSVNGTASNYANVEGQTLGNGTLQSFYLTAR